MKFGKINEWILFLLLNYWPEEELVFDFGVNCLFKGLQDTKRLIQSTGFCCCWLEVWGKKINVGNVQMGIFRYLLTFCYPNDSLTKWFEDTEKSKSKLVSSSYSDLLPLYFPLFLNYCPYSGYILTGNWIVTLQKFMILAVNPLQAEDRNVKHNSLQDLLGVWFMQILLNRFLPLWIVSLYNLGSADIYNAKAITSCNHPNCIDSFISTALFIWKILSMDPCITFMSCWAHKYFPWISPYINPIGSLCLH